MDHRIAKTVSARWMFRAAATDQDVANDLVAWAERESGRFLIAKDYLREEVLRLRRDPDDNTFTPLVTLEEETFADAKASVTAMIPKFLAALAKKFRDQFYVRSTQQRFKLYLYFSGDPALETIALTLTLKGRKPFLWLGYIPNKLVGGADFAKAIQDQTTVTDPELAGLSMMRLVRSLLAKIQ